MKKTKSIITKYERNCFYCGRPCETEHHLLFGNGMRELAEEDGIKVPVCGLHHVSAELVRRIHDNPMAERLSKIAGQLAWEKHEISKSGCTEDEAREKFRRRYKESYL